MCLLILMFHSVARKVMKLKNELQKISVGLKLSESPCSAVLVLALNVVLSAYTLILI